MKTKFLMIAALGLFLAGCKRQGLRPRRTWIGSRARGTSFPRRKMGTSCPRIRSRRRPLSLRVTHSCSQGRPITPRAGVGRSRSTKRRHQRKWTPSRPTKKSCSASTDWKRTVTRCASLRPASHAPPNSLRRPGVATFSNPGNGRTSSGQLPAGWLKREVERVVPVARRSNA